ncbi:MAG: hypothetical protein IJH65_04780 [Methanobrevibacter sp.]|nr:hypothetical protein [Methanobrevibacter sp.]
MPPRATVRVPAVILLAFKLGMSAATNALNDGAAVDPEPGPAKTVFIAAVAAPVPP